jgi:hypothetical protein
MSASTPAGQRRARLVHLITLTLGLGLAASHAAPTPPTDWADVYNPFVVRSLHVRLTEANYQTIRFDESFTIEVPAVFWLEGDGPVNPGTGLVEPTTYSILIRRKSATAINDKVSYRVDFNAGRWYDLKKLSLENGDDNNVVSEGLSWLLHRRAATATYRPSLAAWTTLTFHLERQVTVLDPNGNPVPLLDGNGNPVLDASGNPVYQTTLVVDTRPQGVYLNVEFVDKYFLAHRGLWQAGSTWLYKQDDIGLPELKETPTGGDSPAHLALDYSPFQAVRKSGKRILNPTPSDPELETDLNGLINMDSMLRLGAVNAFTDNPDELFNKGKNYHWVDYADQVRFYFPWDLDASIRSTTANIYAIATSTDRRGKVTLSQHPYQSVILNHPRFRAQYNQILLSLLDGPMHPTLISGDLSQIEAVLTDPLLADPNNKIGSTPDAVAGLFNHLRSWLAARATNVRSQAQANKNPVPRPDY